MARWWRLILGLIAAASVSAMLVAWLLFQHVPSWYQPALVAPQDYQRIRNDALGAYTAITDQLAGSDAPFQCHFTQEQVNAWLAAREEIWPWSREWLPPQLSDPAVTIDESGLRVAATYRDGDVATVLSVLVEASADQAGIRVRLLRVAGGSLRLPKSLIRARLAEIDERLGRGGQRRGAHNDGRRTPRLANLFDGVVFPNEWNWKHASRPCRVVGVRFTTGAVDVTFQPLARQSPTRSSSQDSSSGS